jgi:glycosyltransferase involved in cell wall biosynthesis
MNASPPRISVLIPTYNRADLLPDAIHSVLAQTRPDFEILIVDDGSTDNTRQVVSAFEDDRICYTYRENGGISAALNTGLSLARGEYVCRLDSDDRWLPTILEKQTAILEAHPEYGAVYSRAQAMDVHGNPLTQTLGALPHYPGQSFKSMLYGDFGCAIATTVRKACYDRVNGYDENLKVNVDWDVWIRLTRHYEFYFLDEVLAQFRHHPKRSTASSLFQYVLASRLTPLDKAFSEPGLPPDILAVRPLAYRNAHMDIAMQWLGVKDYAQARQHFAESIRISGRPVTTLGRIVWLVTYYRFLSKHAWGIQLVHQMKQYRQNLTRR